MPQADPPGETGVSEETRPDPVSHLSSLLVLNTSLRVLFPDLRNE